MKKITIVTVLAALFAFVAIGCSSQAEGVSKDENSKNLEETVNAPAGGAAAPGAQDELDATGEY